MFNTIKVNNTDTDYTHSIFDISDYNSGAKYTDLSAALAAIPESKLQGGMSVKFIQQVTLARYSVVKTENLETEPTGTLLSEAPYIDSGTYAESQLRTIFSTLPSSTGAENALTYYVAVTVDESTTYTSWVITKVQTNVNKYMQYRLMSDSFNTTPSNWQSLNADDEPTAGSNNLAKSGSVFDIQKDLEKTNSTIGRESVILPNGTRNTKIPTTTGTVSAGDNWKAYDYNVENINYVDIYSNIIVMSTTFPTAVLWALYDTDVALGSQPMAYGPLLSTGEQRGSCDLSQYPTRKILRVSVYVNQTTPVTEVKYYTADLVKHSEISNVLRTTDVIDSLNSEQSEKPLSAKQGKVLNESLAEKLNTSDVEDNLLSNASNKPLSAKQGRILDNKIEDAVYNVDIVNLTPTNTGATNIPKADGSSMSGGTIWKRNDYNVSGIDDVITIITNATKGDTPTLFVGCVYFILKDENNNVLFAGEDIHKENPSPVLLDLSLYPTAYLLLITVDYTTKASSVSYKVRTPKFISHNDIIDNLESEDETKVLSAKQGKVLDNKIENIGHSTEVVSLPTTSQTAGGQIPKADGTLMSGGSARYRWDYDMTNIDKVITITTDVTPVETATQFVGCVYFVLCEMTGQHLVNVLYAGPDIHQPNNSPYTLDLSQFTIAEGNTLLLRVAVGTQKVSSVTYEKIVNTFLTPEDIVDNLESEDSDKVLSAKQGKVLKEKIENYAQEVLLAMPPVIELVGKNSDSSIYGNRLQIYYRDIVGAVDPFKYHMKPICAGGQIKHRYFGYDAKLSTIGDVAFKLQIQNDNGSIVTEKNTIIKVIAPPTSPASNKNILLLGSSTLGTGTVAKEVHRRLCEASGSNNTYRDNPKGLGLTNISFVGRRYGYVYNEVLQESIGGAGFSKKYAIDSGNQIRFYVASGNVELSDVYSDGVTNYTVTEDNVASVGGGNFLTAQATDPVSASGTLTKVSGGGDATIDYTSYLKESGNPFWDRTLTTPGLNFQKYADEYCNGTIDMIVSLMTGNDLSAVNGNIELLLTNYVKPFVRKFHSDFPNGKFIFGIQPPYSIYGDSQYTYDMKIWTIKYALALYDMAEDNEFSSYFSIAHTLQLFDNDNMFPLSNQAVANRLPNVYEKETINGTHPTGAGGQFQIGQDEAGCLTLADGLYYAICAAL